jgi:hypothetical protein
MYTMLLILLILLLVNYAIVVFIEINSNGMKYDWLYLPYVVLAIVLHEGYRYLKNKNDL